MPKSVVLAGAGPFALPVFKALSSCDWLAAVVTSVDSRKGRGLKSLEDPVATAAQEAGIEVHKFDDINKQTETLKSTGAQLLLTASYGQFVKRVVRECLPLGSYNLHPSLLPHYRGATPVVAALKDGCSQTGVNSFKMVSKMDAGPIAAQETIDILPDETADQLLLRCAALAGSLALKTLPDIFDGSVSLIEQDSSQASECHKLTKQDAALDLSRSAKTLHNQIRAHHPWPGSTLAYKGQTLKVSGSHLSTLNKSDATPGTVLDISNTLTLATGDGALELSTFQLPGKKPVDAKAFANGQRLKIGDIIN